MPDGPPPIQPFPIRFSDRRVSSATSHSIRSAALSIIAGLALAMPACAGRVLAPKLAIAAQHGAVLPRLNPWCCGKQWLAALGCHGDAMIVAGSNS